MLKTLGWHIADAVIRFREKRLRKRSGEHKLSEREMSGGNPIPESPVRSERLDTLATK